jgi:hypothetical protein
MDRSLPEKPILCPSARPDTADTKVYGVFIDTPQAGVRVGYLTEAQPITPDIVAATQPARPAEVLLVGWIVESSQQFRKDVPAAPIWQFFSESPTRPDDSFMSLVRDRQIRRCLRRQSVLESRLDAV